MPGAVGGRYQVDCWTQVLHSHAILHTLPIGVLQQVVCVVLDDDEVMLAAHVIHLLLSKTWLGYASWVLASWDAIQNAWPGTLCVYVPRLHDLCIQG